MPRLFNAFPVLALVLSGIMALSACVPYYINTADLGQRASAEEIRAHYSGKSIRYPSRAGGPIDVETYFAPDGAYKLVVLDSPQLAFGTWRVEDTLGPAKLIISGREYFVADGQVSDRPLNFTGVIYIQPDASVVVDQIGGGNFDQPKPTSVFQAEARWNALRRQAGF